ncbi:hypothetical protein EVAR_51148_1 [Eumeta japonica]|uniref:Uncharacterized protein n=1 Tax=Eumeta variegata TaxID=151549 RepID=A0A4C1YNT0_EUMVA|nr:hypothetical protein EVAR_51148_1 [Eumeta japonica]
MVDEVRTVERTKLCRSELTANCSDITLRGPFFFSAVSYFTPLRRFRDELHSGKVSGDERASSRVPHRDPTAVYVSELPGEQKYPGVRAGPINTRCCD